MHRWALHKKSNQQNSGAHQNRERWRLGLCSQRIIPLKRPLMSLTEGDPVASASGSDNGSRFFCKAVPRQLFVQNPGFGVRPGIIISGDVADFDSRSRWWSRKPRCLISPSRITQRVQRSGEANLEKACVTFTASSIRNGSRSNTTSGARSNPRFR